MHCPFIVIVLQFSGRDAPSTVISFAQKSLKDGQVVSKLHVIELGAVPGGGWCCCCSSAGPIRSLQHISDTLSLSRAVTGMCFGRWVKVCCRT